MKYAIRLNSIALNRLKSSSKMDYNFLACHRVDLANGSFDSGMSRVKFGSGHIWVK